MAHRGNRHLGFGTMALTCRVEEPSTASFADITGLSGGVRYAWCWRRTVVGFGVFVRKRRDKRQCDRPTANYVDRALDAVHAGLPREDETVVALRCPVS